MNDTSKKIVNRLKGAKDITKVFNNLICQRYKVLTLKDKDFYRTIIQKENTSIEVLWQNIKEIEVISNSPYKQAILLIKY